MMVVDYFVANDGREIGKPKCHEIIIVSFGSDTL